jgi:hypothetical protein
MFYRIIPCRGKFNLGWPASGPDFQLPRGRRFVESVLTFKKSIFREGKELPGCARASAPAGISGRLGVWSVRLRLCSSPWIFPLTLR